jgi:hypothetical protein
VGSINTLLATGGCDLDQSAPPEIKPKSGTSTMAGWTAAAASCFLAVTALAI